MFCHNMWDNYQGSSNLLCVIGLSYRKGWKRTGDKERMIHLKYFLLVWNCFKSNRTLHTCLYA